MAQELTPKNLPEQLIKIGRYFERMEKGGVNPNLIFFMRQRLEAESYDAINDMINAAKETDD